VKNC
jgi:hypothetical protein